MPLLLLTKAQRTEAEKSNAFKLEMMVSVFEASRDMKRLIERKVIAPTGLTDEEADIIYATYSILKGNENSGKTELGWVLLDDVRTVAVYGRYEGSKATRLLASLTTGKSSNRPIYMEISKLGDRTQVGAAGTIKPRSGGRLHGNLAVVRLTKEGSEIAARLDSLYSELADAMYSALPEENRSGQVEAQVTLNRALSRIVRDAIG